MAKAKVDQASATAGTGSQERLASVTNQPASALPWSEWRRAHDNSLNVKNGALKFVCEVGKISDENEVVAGEINRDARYIIHAANAYPKLVEALKDALAVMRPESMFLAQTVELLRELGEAE